MTHPAAVRRICLIAAVGSDVGGNAAEAGLLARCKGVLDRVLRSAGAGGVGTWRQDRGGRHLVLLPVGIQARTAVPLLIEGLVEQLGLDRAEAGAGAVRPRISLAEGTVTQARGGYAGQAIVTASRLLDSDDLRGALTGTPDALLAMIVSADLYAEAVAPAVGEGLAEGFRRVSVDAPDNLWQGVGWVRVWRPAAAGARGSRRRRRRDAASRFWTCVPDGSRWRARRHFHHRPVQRRAPTRTAPTGRRRTPPRPARSTPTAPSTRTAKITPTPPRITTSCRKVPATCRRPWCTPDTRTRAGTRAAPGTTAPTITPPATITRAEWSEPDRPARRPARSRTRLAAPPGPRVAGRLRTRRGARRGPGRAVSGANVGTPAGPPAAFGGGVPAGCHPGAVGCGRCWPGSGVGAAGWGAWGAGWGALAGLSGSQPLPVHAKAWSAAPSRQHTIVDSSIRWLYTYTPRRANHTRSPRSRVHSSCPVGGAGGCFWAGAPLGPGANRS